MSEIVNRVANSALEVFDLEDYYTEGQRVALDISQWLSGGFILKDGMMSCSDKPGLGVERIN